MEIPVQIQQDAARLKAYFPYRHVWIAHKEGVWETGCKPTMHQPNNLSRKGWDVFIYGIKND